MKPNNIILETIVGSHLYNLQTKDSDIDIKGIYIEDVEKFLGLNEPSKVIDNTNPDWAYYEIKQFIKLALNCNPTILELLYSGSYLQLTPIGLDLIKNRKKFLSKKAYKSYLGYAKHQFYKKYDKLNNINSFRGGKHLRHVYRLVNQYEELARTGELRVRLTDEEREKCFKFMENSYEECLDWFNKKEKSIKENDSILNEKPDYEFWNNWLIESRKNQL